MIFINTIGIVVSRIHQPEAGAQKRFVARVAGDGVLFEASIEGNTATWEPWLAFLFSRGIREEIWVAEVSWAAFGKQQGEKSESEDTVYICMYQ